MRIYHYITLTDNYLFSNLKKAGVKFKDTKSHIHVFEIFEDDALWESVKKILSISSEYKDTDSKYYGLVTTYFTHNELLKANYIMLRSELYHQYPLPEDMEKIYFQTYDNKGCCRCGIGFMQINPFKITKEPNWRRKKHCFFNLNGIHDELFVKKQTWEQYLEPLGIKSMPVLKGARGLSELQGVVQLKIDKISDYPLDIESYEYLNDLEHDSCDKCGYKKTVWFRRGRFPVFKGDTYALIFKTQEYFGSGGATNREIIIKPELYQVLYDNNLTEKLHFSVLGDP
jgi:hypothetical protein